jgi:sugar-specific transcriptional regulator TrmB
MNDHVKRLVDSGLSEREAKLYLALIEHPGVTGRELQRLAGIPANKVYETLHRMVERKLCLARQAGNIKRYSPVEPRLFVEQHKRQMNAQIVNLERVGAELTEIYEKRDKEPISLEYVEVLNTREQVARWLSHLVENCRDELLVFTRYPGTIQTTKEADEATLRSLRRIKDVRSIYEYGNGMSQEWLRYIRKWHDAGEKSRFVRNLPTRIMIFDGVHALTLAQDSENPSSEVCMLLTNRQLAQAFRILFKHTWNEAIPFEEFMTNYEQIVAESTARRLSDNLPD